MFVRGAGSPDTSTTTNSTSLANTPTSVATTIPSSSSKATPSRTAVSQIARVGATITVGSVGCTLVSVNTLPGDEIAQPKRGNEFIVVHVKIHNGSSQQAHYHPFDFHVKSGAGTITDEDFAIPSSYTANNERNSGQLDPDEGVEGDILFQVPINDHKAELTWQPNVFGNATHKAWNLGL